MEEQPNSSKKKKKKGKVQAAVVQAESSLAEVPPVLPEIDPEPNHKKRLNIPEEKPKADKGPKDKPGSPTVKAKARKDPIEVESVVRGPEESKKKSKQKKQKGAEDWDEGMLLSLIEKYKDRPENAEDPDPTPGEDSADSKQMRRKRRKEAQEKKDKEKQREQPDPLASMARQQTEGRLRHQQMLQCFQRVEECEAARAFKEQLAHLGTALVIAQQLGSSDAMTKCYAKIGKAYYGMEDYAMSIKYLEKAVKLLEEAKEIMELARSFAQMAAAYDKLGDHDREMEFYAKSVKVMEGQPGRLEELRDTPHRGLADSFLTAGSGLHAPEGAEKLQQLGHMYQTLFKDFRCAIVCFEHAMTLYAQEEATAHLQALPMGCLGELYLELRDYRNARGHLEKCLQCCQDHLADPKAQQAFMLAYCCLARCLLKEGKPRQAENVLRKNQEKTQAFSILSSGSPWEIHARYDGERKDCYGLLQCALIEQKRPEEAWLNVENGRGQQLVDALRKQHRLEDRPYGIPLITYDAIRDLAFRLHITLVHYADLEADIACWVVQPNVHKIAFMRLKKPFKRRNKDWDCDELMSHTHATIQATQEEMITPIRHLLPTEKDALVGFVVSDQGPIREVSFASLVAHGEGPLCRHHPLFTVHSVAVLAFLVDVLLAARANPAELPIGLSDFAPHISVPHPNDASKTMGLQHKHLLNEWGVDVLLASLPRSSCLDDVDA